MKRKGEFWLQYFFNCFTKGWVTFVFSVSAARDRAVMGTFSSGFVLPWAPGIRACVTSLFCCVPLYFYFSLECISYSKNARERPCIRTTSNELWRTNAHDRWRRIADGGAC